jgi:GPH family glycoside/pentoside/hexuronide:cation symporter
MLFKSRSWVLNTLYFLFYGVCNVLTMTVVSYYASYVLGATSMTTPILAAFMVMYVVAAVMTPSIDRYLGRRKTMLVSLAIQIITKIPFLIWPHSLVCILINAAGCGIGGSMVFVIAGTNRSTIADILELRSGRRMDSMVASGENLLLKLLEALVQWIITFVLALAGFEASKGIFQSRATLSTICNFLGIVPMLICVVSVFFVRKLDIQRDYDEQKARYEAGKV